MVAIVGSRVFGSVAEFGVSSKPERGVEEFPGELPDILRSALVTIEDYAKRKGIDLSAPLADIAFRLTKPMGNRIADKLIYPFNYPDTSSYESALHGLARELEKPTTMQKGTFEQLQTLLESMSMQVAQGQESPDFDEVYGAVDRLLDVAPWKIDMDGGGVVPVDRAEQESSLYPSL